MKLPVHEQQSFGGGGGGGGSDGGGPLNGKLEMELMPKAKRAKKLFTHPTRQKWGNTAKIYLLNNEARVCRRRHRC